MNVLSLFDGISCGQVALERAGIKVDKYYASEIDKHAIRVTQNNYSNTIQLGDVTNHMFWNIDWKSIDLILAGSPCQGLSFAGLGKNFQDTRSRLFFCFEDILNYTKKQNPNVKFLLENVEMKNEIICIISEKLNVTPKHINSSCFVQQNRPRVYWFNWYAKKPTPCEWTGEFWQFRRTHFRKNKSGVCPCLTANMGTGGHNVPFRSANLKDKLTPEDCEALQGLPVGYTKGVATSHRYKALGNGWTVDVIAYLLKQAEFVAAMEGKS